MVWANVLQSLAYYHEPLGRPKELETGDILRQWAINPNLHTFRMEKSCGVLAVTCKALCSEGKGVAFWLFSKPGSNEILALIEKARVRQGSKIWTGKKRFAA